MAGIYIHIPFCKQACSYCDFHFSTQLKNKNALINGIIKEASERRNYFSEKIESIYFGGGTPSLLSDLEINSIIDTLDKNFELKEDIEITLEANPDDLNKSYLKELKNTSINRLSIGVQSFDDWDLKFMNRAHNSAEAESSIKLSQDAGYSNLTMDLIFGSPSTTKEKWEKNLDLFFSLNIPHLSAYSLTVEKGTKLYHDIKKLKVSELDDYKAYEQYSFLQNKVLDFGYEQYEVSNYCKNETYAKHNTSYWRGVPYLGLGPSAHSYDGKNRQWNLSNNSIYIKNLNSGISYFEKETLSETDRYHEFLITRFRTKWGISIKDMRTLFSNPVYEHFQKKFKTIKDKFIIEGDSVRLKRNLLFESDSIIRELMI